jgi:sugar lactone lactonase YvrE
MKMAAALLIAMLTGGAADARAAPTLGAYSDFFVGDASPFIAEGIARDPATDRMFIASVASRRIVAIHGGKARDFVQLPDDYSPFGIAVANRKLWVTAGVVAQGAGFDGPSALIAFDLSGKVAGTYPVRDEGRHVLGDLTIAPDGTVYASDGLDGSIYMLPPGADALKRLGPQKLFKSPQGMAVNADGKSLLVVDYALGLTKLDLATASFRTLKIPEGVNVKGIDGLARLPDGSFLASQNGTSYRMFCGSHFHPTGRRCF